jgi:isopropylmalate/homocitrate/citramalate synthase
VVSDVALAADCGVKGIVIEIPSSAHLIEQGYKWPLEKAIDLSIKATAYAKELGLYTVFFTIDATRSDLGWLLNLVDRVATEGHMDAFTLVDTFGALCPQAAAYFTKKVRERITKPLEIHFHSDFGMGVANTINAVMAGGEVIHTTVLGIGERAGNTPMEETVLALLTMYGIDVGIDYSKMNELSQLVRQLSGVQVPSSRPFVGDGAYTIESGIVTGWFRNAYKAHPTTLYPVRPQFVGRGHPQIAMGKKSGVDNIWVWAEKLGISISQDEAMELVQTVKLKSHDLKRVLTEDEFAELAEAIKQRRPGRP